MHNSVTKPKSLVPVYQSAMRRRQCRPQLVPSQRLARFPGCRGRLLRPYLPGYASEANWPPSRGRPTGRLGRTPQANTRFNNECHPPHRAAATHRRSASRGSHSSAPAMRSGSGRRVGINHNILPTLENGSIFQNIIHNK